MEKNFNKIKDLSNKYDKSISLLMNKLGEEIGELYQSVNMLPELGLKKTDLNLSEIENTIKSEIADCMQILMNIAQRVNCDYNELNNLIEEKNKKWSDKYIK